jgi:hypothetical protein
MRLTILENAATIVRAAFAAPGLPEVGKSAELTSRDGDEPSDEERALRRYLLYVLLPLWFVPGIADWYWHKRSDIEHTAGTHESLTHALMMASVGLPVTAALLCDINALVLVMMMAGVVSHEAVSYWDVSYARERREVAAIEQHTHSFLEMLPVMAMSMAICLKPRQFAAIFGRGDEPARWKLEPKRPRLTIRYIATILTGVTAFVVVPYAEEFVRCWRVDRTLAPHEPATD